MKKSFTYFMPTKVIFGSGKLDELAKVSLPGKKALLVIGAGGNMRKLGYLKRVENLLKKQNVESVVYDKIQPNPLTEHVDEAAGIARKERCDFILGLGGGSTIDSAKSIAIMAKNDGKYWDYINGGSGGGKKPKNGALPIVAITTTAGTGTEADPWTVITKPDTNEKIGWGNDDTFPVLSIVDPELMKSVPPKMTAFTGMDTFFHAVEAYIATVSHPVGDPLALEAIGLIAVYLPKAVKDGNDIEARTMVAWANTEAGICESTSSCISHHSLEHAISAYHQDLPHGAGLVLTSVAYFSHLAKKLPERFGDMAAAMGEDITGLSEADSAMVFVTALKKLIKNIGLEDLKLSDYGVKPDEAQKIAKNSFENMGGLYDVTPVKLTERDVVEIFKNAYR
jgi:alcohol dehydrogenase